MYPLITKLIFILSLSTVCTCAKLNLTRLMNIYINACGEWGVCKHWPGFIGYQKNLVQSRCPPCSCEDDCVLKERCCPDKFFEGKLTRFHDAVFQGSPSRKTDAVPPKYHVVDSCPDFAEKVDKCQNPANHFEDRVFVTSLVSNYTYYNIHCAECNDEKKSDTEEWDISIDGDKSYINFIESNDVLERLIKEQNSFVVFFPTSRLKDIVIPVSLEENQYLTESCPGDEDLQKACLSSYVNQIRLFRNVFCYLCKLKNIRRFQNVIRICPKSAPKTIKQLCHDNPVSSLTHPYRNFYCFLCNIPIIKDAGNTPDLKSVTKKYVFLDFSSDVYESFEERETMLTGRRVHFYNNGFNGMSIINKIMNSKTTKNQIESSANLSGYITDQFKSFLYKMAAVYPHRICNRAILPINVQNTTIRNCDCSFSCLFKNPCSCCLDTTLIHPTECVSNARVLFSNDNTVLKNKEVTKIQIVNVCYIERINVANIVLHQKIKQLCEGELNDFDVPVLSNQVTYKNVFCFLCNTNYTIANNSLFSDPYKVKDVSIICDSLLQFDFLLNFSQVLTQAFKNKCDIIYNYNDAVLCSTDKVKTIKTVNECKTSVKGVEIDQVENWEYENKSHHAFFPTCRYKNEFCNLCSLSNKLELLNKVVVCKKSGIQHVTYRNSCLSLPSEQYQDLVHPYRNVFCSYCMQEYKELYPRNSLEACVTVLQDNRQKIRLMRDLFVPTMTFTASTFQVNSKSTDHACFPGRVLISGSCKSIIVSPSKMLYDLHIQCNLRVTSPTNDTEHVLSKVRSAVFEVLSNSTFVYGCDVWKLYLLAHPRDVQVYQQGLFHLELQVTLHYVLFCSQVVKPFVRDTMENNLLQTPHLLMINHTVDGPDRISFVLRGISFCNISSTLIQSKLIPKNDFHSLKKYYQFVVIFRPYDGIIVSKLLICPQRILNVDEVYFDYMHYRIIVNNSNEVFHLGEYVIDYNDKIRVCIKSQSVPSEAHIISEILETLTNILNAISIFSIVLLFIIYLKFPALRTLPGLNVMSTTFSLMCMQLTYTVANVLQKGTLYCRLIGVLLHYFWLCLCCCLFICCLHMFITFRNLNVSNFIHDGKVSKLFVRYTTFSYMFPFLAVSTNVMMSYYIDGSIGYGTRVCFVERFIQNIVTFIVPLLMTCVCNAIMYILTIINIDFDKNIQKSRKNRSELVIFTKLFCLTGSVWILQVIDSFLQISFFSFAVTMLTSSQGFFLFLSFSSSSYIKKFFKSR